MLQHALIRILHYVSLAACLLPIICYIIYLISRDTKIEVYLFILFLDFIDEILFRFTTIELVGAYIIAFVVYYSTRPFIDVR
jgi:hypothetical protein